MAYQNKSVSVHQFAMIPSAEVPRSRFKIEKLHKTSFDAGYLIPFYIDEILPGDSFNVHTTIFGRLATPIFPVMDNIYLDTFYFFVPNRLVWDNWAKFMGEQRNPTDSISYLVPQLPMPAGGFTPLSLGDYMGLPTSGQIGPGIAGINVCSLPMRAYNLIWNEWFRDENLQNSVVVDLDDGPDQMSDYVLLRRGKRKDYFTGALPWPQKGPSVSTPLGTSAPVIGNNLAIGFRNATPESGASNRAGLSVGSNGTLFAYQGDFQKSVGGATSGLPTFGTQNVAIGLTQATDGSSGMIADLSQATAATINQLRQAFQIQRLLERDARGGTRYTEILRAHFGVTSPDARLQRPEYLGGGSSRIQVSPIAQTSSTPETGTGTPQGNLAAMGTVLSQKHGFNQSFTEHGFIIGLCSVRADLNYQQGLRKMWSRRTRYDFYFPAFAHLGEQAILNKEIYAVGGDGVQDNAVFGYQERWAEMRYNPSMITGLFRSTTPSTIDAWHLAQRFTSLPTLGPTFIEERPPLDRVLAVHEDANGQQIIADIFTSAIATRPMPMYSVPGLIDHL